MGIRIVVAVAIIVPLMALTGFNNEWYVTFAIAMLGFGAGHVVEYLIERNKSGRDGD